MLHQHQVIGWFDKYGSGDITTSGLRTTSLAELDGCFVLKSQFSKRCRENRANHCCVRVERTKPSTGSISNQDVCLDITSHWSIMHETRVRSRVPVCKNSSKPRVYRYTKIHTCLHFALKPEIVYIVIEKIPGTSGTNTDNLDRLWTFKTTSNKRQTSHFYYVILSVFIVELCVLSLEKNKYWHRTQQNKKYSQHCWDTFYWRLIYCGLVH